MPGKPSSDWSLFVPKVGEVYYNPKRGNCLRLTHVDLEAQTVHCLAFRPNGAKISTQLKVTIKGLFVNYERVERIAITVNRKRIEVYANG